MTAARGLVLGLLLGACGSGTVDPGFYEPVIVSQAEPTPSATAPARPPPPGDAFDRPKLVLITADWCHFCRQAEPALMEAYGPYRGKVKLVELDVTDDFTTREAAALATDEGVRAFFDRFQGRTPSVGVFVGVNDGRLVHGDLEDPETLRRELEHAVMSRRPDEQAP